MSPIDKNKNQRKMDLTFSVLDSMEDLRDLWRASAPVMELEGSEREEALKLLEKARKALDGLEKII